MHDAAAVSVDGVVVIAVGKRTPVSTMFVLFSIVWTV
jgi:hypothetical protein